MQLKSEEIVRPRIAIFVCDVDEPRTRMLTVRVSEREYQRVKRAAERDQRKIADYCRIAVLEKAGRSGEVEETKVAAKKKQ
jgi:hypothetical protein